MEQEQKDIVVYEFDLGTENVDFVINTVGRIEKTMSNHTLYGMVNPESIIVSKMRRISVDAMFFLLMETNEKHEVLTVDSHQLNLLVDIFDSTLDFIKSQLIHLGAQFTNAKEDVKTTLELTYRDAEFVEFAGTHLQNSIREKMTELEELAMDIGKAKNFVIHTL